MIFMLPINKYPYLLVGLSFDCIRNNSNTKCEHKLIIKLKYICTKSKVHSFMYSFDANAIIASQFTVDIYDFQMNIKSKHT